LVMDIMPCTRTLLLGYSSTTHCSEPICFPSRSCLERLIQPPFSGSVPHVLPSSSCLLERFKCSPGSHSLSVSCFVGITSSCSLLAFPLSVSLASSSLCSSVPRTRNCATLLLIVASVVLKKPSS